MPSERGGHAPTATPVTTQPRRPALSWAVKIKKKLKPVAPFLGKFRPAVGQCCHQCTPESLSWKLLQASPSLGFQNLLAVNEMHTRYRGWLVRRLCCVLFVGGCRVYPNTASDRAQRVCTSEGGGGGGEREREMDRAGEKDSGSRAVQRAIGQSDGPFEQNAQQLLRLTTRGRAAHILPIIDTCISPLPLRIAGWLLLKLLSRVFCSVQVNLSQLAALHKASEMDSPLVYVSVQHCALSYVLLPLVLFCHSLRVPYTVCPLSVGNACLRSFLQKLGVILLPGPSVAEQDAEQDGLYGPLMTSLVSELLRQQQSLSVSLAPGSGRGGQWLVRVWEAVRDGSVRDVSLVPVSVAYDRPPDGGIHRPGSALSLLRYVLSLFLFGGGLRGSVRIHFGQAFSLKEMWQTGRCRVDGGHPLQELLLPAVLISSLSHRPGVIFGQKAVSWVLPPSFCPDLPPPERQFCIALIQHLLHSAASCSAVMSTSLVSCLLLHKHRTGVCLSELCRDASWLLEEVLFRNRDVGFGGSLSGVMYHAVSLLRPSLVMVRPPRGVGEPRLAPRLSPAAVLCLASHAEVLTHVFILEAVGACAVSAMLGEVARCGGGRGGEELEIDLALGQEELTEKALQLCYLLPLGHRPPCQSPLSFALDAVDSLVRCGILVMEELPKDRPVCDFLRKQGTLTWCAMDDPDHSDSDCGEQDTRCYKLSQPSQCPELLLFLCSLLSVQLRALSWAIEALPSIPTPLTESDCVTEVHACLMDRARRDRRLFESSSVEMAREAVRTLTDLGVLEEVVRTDGVYLRISALFEPAESRDKLRKFISQFLSN
ncbi:hypothetical protein GJAV_G00035370 [Gymnothorax javanicus]|nr:hypothetical protein GJAV_G00035370 [Gymnothorax javanicus]